MPTKMCHKSVFPAILKEIDKLDKLVQKALSNQTEEFAVLHSSFERMTIYVEVLRKEAVQCLDMSQKDQSA